MDDDEPPAEARSGRKSAPAARDEREARLAAALRANLRRRKAAEPGRGGKPDG
jgi:hypothetical protein